MRNRSLVKKYNPKRNFTYDSFLFCLIKNTEKLFWTNFGKKIQKIKIMIINTKYMYNINAPYIQPL